MWCEILGQKAAKTAMCYFLNNYTFSLLIAVIPITFEEIQVYFYLSDTAYFLFASLIQHFRLPLEKLPTGWLL